MAIRFCSVNGARRCRASGFSLIELMIVIVIISILVKVAFPAYNSQMVKSRRTDAQREVVSYAQSLERWFTTNGKYTDSAGTACGVSYSGSNAYYAIAGACAGTTFTITATPNTSGPQSDDGTLTLTESGTRGGSVNSGSWKY